MRIPLIVRVPGVQAGQRRTALIESIDLYPSLCELAGVSPPEHLQGRSFQPLLSDPNSPWKTAAVGRYQNGDTIRTDRYRFTEYTDREDTPRARMLYDHRVDPGENQNVAQSHQEDASHQEAARELAAQLRRLKGKDAP